MSKILNDFVKKSQDWYRWPRNRHCVEAWQDAYIALVKTYGADAVIRHNRAIGAVLERAEKNIRATWEEAK